MSALVREFLVGVSDEESDFERRKRLQKEIQASVKRFSAGKRIGRDQVHERNAVR